MIKLFEKIRVKMEIFLIVLFVILSAAADQDPPQTRVRWIPHRVRNDKRENRNKSGFTIAELLISTFILGILATAGVALSTSFFNSYRNIEAANAVYDEARFTMEKIVKEVRQGTIDYEEYYNQTINFTGAATVKNETYGKNYCQYSRQFYSPGPDGEFDTYDDISTGKRDSVLAPIQGAAQNQLFLINTEGTGRTYLKHIKTTDGGKIAILKMTGKDYGIDHIKSGVGSCAKDIGEGDGLIDTWECEKGFNCTPTDITNGNCSGKAYTAFDDPNPTKPTSSFVDITPSSLDISDLKFFVAPMDDPYKAYSDSNAQIQPHVTIKFTAKANPKLVSKLKGGIPNIILESTVSSRAYSEIITKCNTKECIDGSTKACPKMGDLVEDAKVTCSQGVYPVCTDKTYENAAKTYIKELYKNSTIPAVQASASDGLDHQSPFDKTPYTFYESDSEFGSCESEFKGESISKCKTRRCSDGFDNDGNGVADEKDPVCLDQICGNGEQDKDDKNVNLEECIDVGGICSTLRPKKTTETGTTDCSDGYDNDCNGEADEFDQNCIDYICSNGIKNPISGVKFLKKTYKPENYLNGADTSDYNNDLNESCIDVGGLCVGASSKQTKINNEDTDTLCSDGLDNDCDGKADELDADCETVICGNKKRDCNLAPKNYSPADYLKGYTEDDPTCAKTLTDNDETCINSGGLCGGLTGNLEICGNGKDDNCNNLIDEKDTSCMATDGYSFTDYLTTADYIDSKSSVKPVNGSLILDGGLNGSVISKAIPVGSSCKNITSATLNHTAVVTAGADIKYILSNNNGSDWFDADSNNKASFTTTGKQLIWKAVLTNNASSKITIDDITVSFICSSD